MRLIGFEKDSELGGLFVQFGLFQDYKATLPDHLFGILRQQHPGLGIESIELLDVPKCKLGGMQQEHSKTLVRVQTMDVPLDLQLIVHVEGARYALDVQLVFICEGLDATPAVRSDMFVRRQKAISWRIRELGPSVLPSAAAASTESLPSKPLLARAGSNGDRAMGAFADSRHPLACLHEPRLR